MSDNTDNPRHRALQVVRISNDLYGSDVLFAFEMAKGSAKPVTVYLPVVEVNQDLIEAQHHPEAKRKLTWILRSKTATDPAL